jgi:murein hydrolase activator
VRRARLPLLALAVWLTAAPAWSQDQPDAAAADRRLRELEDQIKRSQSEHAEIKRKARAISDELGHIRADMVAAARAAQDSEELLSELEHQLEDLKTLEGDRAAALQRRSSQMTGVLTALERLAWRPTEALMAQPQTPAETVRSAILLRAAVPQIERSVHDLKDEIDVMSRLRADITNQRQRIGNTALRLDGEHKRLKELWDRKSTLQYAAIAETEASEQRVRQLAGEAQDLRELMQRLEEERQRRILEAAEKAAAEKAARDADLAARKAAREAEIAAQKAARVLENAAREAAEAKPMVSDKPIASVQGKMVFPAKGNVVERFGQPNEVGVINKGISIATRKGAQIIATYDGQVAFAGPFRGYGLLLIIDHGEGYHTLLAGMARIDANVGQRLTAGEPVGIMGEDEAKPALYIELRRQGQPVNPLPWLTAQKSKGHG